jgi:hypothetical protein
MATVCLAAQMNGLSMVTYIIYIIMAFAVALLAGFTGGMPRGIIVTTRSGSTERADADANATTEASDHNIAISRGNCHPRSWMLSRKSGY